MLWSHDGVWTRNAPGDAGLEVDGNVHYNLNTGGRAGGSLQLLGCVGCVGSRDFCCV